jgi:GMP synthase-like glutamine amidotransferase
VSGAPGPVDRELWVVDPSVIHAEEQGTREVLRGWPGRSRVFRPVLQPGDGPAPGVDYALDGLVLLGSAASVHEPLAWMRALSDWLAPILEGKIRVPVLGICFGHQLIAHMAGADVGFVRPDRRKLVGVELSQLLGHRLLSEPQALRVVVSHREEVKHCPERYRIVAHRGPIAIDGLEHCSLPVWSYQFHTEARDEFASRAGLDPVLIGRRVREDSQRLLGAFRDLVLS